MTAFCCDSFEPVNVVVTQLLYISFASKFELYKSLVTTLLLRDCETWTLLACWPDSALLLRKKRIQAFQTKCLGKLLRTSYLKHKTNDWIRSKINFPVGSMGLFLAAVKRRKLTWFEHISRHNILPKTVLKGTLEGGRYLGRQRNCWIDNIKQ